MAYNLTAELQLQLMAEFDCPFRVAEDGELIDVGEIYAPEVCHSETDDIEIFSDKWEALTGYTGQYSYNGAVMHSSEYLGGRLARDILETPGVYVLVAVSVHDSEDCAGWAVLRRVVA